jgi:hypothetical protein
VTRLCKCTARGSDALVRADEEAAKGHDRAAQMPYARLARVAAVLPEAATVPRGQGADDPWHAPSWNGRSASAASGTCGPQRAAATRSGRHDPSPRTATPPFLGAIATRSGRPSRPFRRLREERRDLSNRPRIGRDPFRYATGALRIPSARLSNGPSVFRLEEEQDARAHRYLEKFSSTKRRRRRVGAAGCTSRSSPESKNRNADGEAEEPWTQLATRIRSRFTES